MKNFVCLSFLLLISSTALANDEAQFRIIFPAYRFPLEPEGIEMWDALIQAAGIPDFELHVIMNPASGPGDFTNPGYLDESVDPPTGVVVDLKQAGAFIYGYVATGFANRDMEAVEADVLGYCEHYPGIIDGFFIDEVSNELGDLDFYSSLRNFISGAMQGAPIIANPGTTFINNTSGQTQFDVVDYIEAFDTIISIENEGPFYFNSYDQADVPVDLNPSQIGHLVHGQMDWEPEFLELALSRGAGFLYFTDDEFDPDDFTIEPFDLLPTFWNDFVSDIIDFNNQTGFFELGNLNGDDQVDLLDVAPFVDLLTNGNFRLQGDLNCDGNVNLLDVAPFVERLTNP